MSTKQELLDALAGEVHTVGTTSYVANPSIETDGFKLYNTIYYDEVFISVSGSYLTRRNANMIVYDDGGAGEEAWWMEGTPQYISGFGDMVRASTKFQTVHGTILSEGPDWAVIEGYTKDTTTVTKKYWLLEDDGAGGVDDFEITNP